VRLVVQIGSISASVSVVVGDMLELAEDNVAWLVIKPEYNLVQSTYYTIDTYTVHRLQCSHSMDKECRISVTLTLVMLFPFTVIIVTFASDIQMLDTVSIVLAVAWCVTRGRLTIGGLGVALLVIAPIMTSMPVLAMLPVIIV